MTSRRIAYAYFDPVWDKSIHSTAQLVRTSVGPLEYQEEMKDHLICPQCYEPLNRIPSESSITIMTDGREALFRHYPNPNAPFCLLRSGAIIGKRYSSEEEAQKAVSDNDVIIISGFMQERPELVYRDNTDSSATPTEMYFESKNGVFVEIPISRHQGETFNLPSKITSVQALCTNFQENYYKEIFITTGTGLAHSYIFCDALKSISDIRSEQEEPGFYFGEISSIEQHTNHSTVWLKLKGSCYYPDFRVRIENNTAISRGITDENAKNRIIIFYAPISSVGMGYWTHILKWGEVGLLAEKHKDFLLDDYNKKHTSNC
ncbi:hypothetical protein KV314_003118 [Escherichia coli]|uniref:hypothetical protein n=1 Tax=Escherichia coli TaxID=562 RepID=UPI0007731964|nr:hypothetical protein [Escherichia coli]EEV5624428.1 hypothetical protein [Escherichia coli]EEY3540145.1 hypothetical protein [Escherichia coli]EEY3545780.1 hypothetical protein [Escherichia coli]EEY3552769.1 hypothetical protein [Escherichia coli]EEY3564994.1 hypothetical protein [Escherichia coli]